MSDIRNVAVIAHVDHGKTTLIDALLKQTHTFRDNQKEMEQAQILDSNDLERERGITILAKNCEINYNNTRINIIDTPGHADFSGEVDRTLGMADGALLIIDAQEGPMPQTRFVLRKALHLGLKIIVVINKIDKPNANISRTLSKIDDLFLELVTNEDDLHFPILFAIARDGKIFTELPDKFGVDANTTPLLDKIIEYIPSPQIGEHDVFKLPITSLEYDNHLGRIIIGKIHSGLIHRGDRVMLTQNPGETFEVTKLFEWEGLGKKEVAQASSGNIVAIAGVGSAEIGQTLSDPSDSESLPSLEIGEPTLHLKIAPNSSPFAGKEGEFTSSRYLADRLQRELETNLSLRVEKVDGGFKVSGRGELHLSILLETMRREGYEMEVGKPQVIVKEIDGVKHEPVEEVSIIVPAEYQGVITSEFGKRFGTNTHIESINDREIEMIFEIPSRATLGLRSLLLTLTKGTVVYNSQVIGWKPMGKPVPKLRRGAMIAAESGKTMTYGLHAAQERGITFVDAGVPVYEGMIVGLHSREDDLEINVCRNKKLTNVRASSADISYALVPPLVYSLEQSLDFLEEDELLEITPQSYRLRKKLLTEIERRRTRRKNKPQVE